MEKSFIMKKCYKIFLLIIGLLLVLSIALCSSYALWISTSTQEGVNAITTDCFKIDFEGQNDISLTNAFPMEDSKGVYETPYEFSVSNTCNHAADFQINLETLASSTVSESFIRVDLNGHINDYNSLDSATPNLSNTKSAVKLHSDTIAPNSNKTYNLRLWINNNATVSDIANKSYNSKVSVKATLRKNYSEGTLISGDNFNVALKKLADGGNPTRITDNTSITSIEWSNSAPQDSDNAIDLAVEGTVKPIFAWFKNGIIYLYSELDKIYLNDDSSYMFRQFKSVTTMDLSHFDSSNVKNMDSMFYEMINLTSLDLSNFDTSNVTSMETTFDGLKKLTSLDLNNFNTSNVTTMKWTFKGMERLTSLNINHFNTTNVTIMSYLFAELSQLRSIDLSSFDTSNVDNMASMFRGMSNLTSIDLSNFNTSKVKSMSQMFKDDFYLTSINISSFDTSTLTDMHSMFSGVSRLTSLDLSNFDTSNVTDMENMFDNCRELSTVYVGDKWNLSKISNQNQFVFSNNKKLVGGAGTAYNTALVQKLTYARVDDPENGKPGYFTLKTT